jgi:hypothetical protein
MNRSLLLVILLALGGGALAQEDGVGGPVRDASPEQLQHCPELKGAIGLRRDQLFALFFELDGRTVDEKKVRALFALPRDAAFLEGFLAEKGRYRCQSGLRAVVAGLGSAGMTWAVDRAENGAPEIRGRALDTLVATDTREVWKVLESKLDDKRAVPDWRAANEAPPGYSDLRVCDHATRVLGSKLIGVTKPPETRVGSLAPIETRDARIVKLKDFLGKDPAYLAHMKALEAK